MDQRIRRWVVSAAASRSVKKRERDVRRFQKRDGVGRRTGGYHNIIRRLAKHPEATEIIIANRGNRGTGGTERGEKKGKRRK